MAWYQKKLSQLFWWLHFNLPDFLFYPWMQKNGEGKIEAFNRKVDRYNKIAGKAVYDKIPKGVYHIAK